MKNWLKETWETIKEVPLKNFVIGGGVFIGTAVVTWIAISLSQRIFCKK